jgi:CMP-N,N'-diacetyllegionaminic acid synthase
MNKPKVLCIICARAGSKRLPNKNFKKLFGRPLIYHTIKQAINSKIFDKVVFSSDSNNLIKMAISFGALAWFVRSKKLSNDKAAKMPVIKNAILESEKKFNYKFDYICDLDVTSPLRKISDIRNAFKKFKNSKQDMLISGNKARKNPFFNMIQKNRKNSIKLVVKPKNFYIRTQDAPKVYELNASIYFWKRNACFRQKGPFCKKTFFYEMPYKRSIDIDNLSDFKLVEFFGKNENQF